MAVLTISGANGDDLQALQPVSGSVLGSPFTAPAGGVAQVTPELKGEGVMVHTTEPVHISFSLDGSLATASDFLLPAGVICTFPTTSGQTVSFLAAGGTDATIYVAEPKVVGPQA